MIDIPDLNPYPPIEAALPDRAAMPLRSVKKMEALPSEIYSEIKGLCESGDQHADGEAYDLAIADFDRAWELLPEPRYRWEAATWILAALGDCNFQLNRFEEAYDFFRLGMIHESPGARENPFFRLRRGQCLFEIGDEVKAAEELAAAYMLNGSQIFEADDPKYFAFLKTYIREPVGGW